MKMSIWNRSYRYNIYGLRSRHGHKYSKYQKCLSMMMLTCIKQHLSNIWSSIYEKVKQHWGWAEKKAFLMKNSVYSETLKSGKPVPKEVKARPIYPTLKLYSEKIYV